MFLNYKKKYETEYLKAKSNNKKLSYTEFLENKIESLEKGRELFLSDMGSIHSRFYGMKDVEYRGVKIFEDLELMARKTCELARRLL